MGAIPGAWVLSAKKDAELLALKRKQFWFRTNAMFGVLTVITADN
jgi:hypothetical protein